MTAEIITSLVSAIIGGFIAGYFSLKATKQMITHENEKSHDEEERIEHGLLQALHDEIDIIWDRYSSMMAPKPESLPDSDPLLVYFPIHQDYFPVYRGNTSLVGRIRDNDMRRAIVGVYTKAAAMIDSFKMNNKLVAKYEYLHASFLSSKKEEDRQMLLVHLTALVAYANALKTSHFELKKDVTGLLHYFNKVSVISEKNR